MVNKERDRRLKIQMQKDTESDLFFSSKARHAAGKGTSSFLRRHYG